MADQEKFEDWCHGIYVTDTMGVGWCVRIDGSSIMDDVGQYNCKPRHSFGLAKGLGSKEEAEAFARNWIKEQADKFGEARAEPVVVPTVQAGDWQQYAKEGESAQDVIERERKDNDALCTLLARARSAAHSQPVAGQDDWNAALDRTIKGFELCFNRSETLDVGYVIDSINAVKRVTTANAGKEAANQPVQAKALTDDLVDWDRISEAAKQACNEYGQWMPERWLQLFVNAYNRNKS